MYLPVHQFLHSPAASPALLCILSSAAGGQPGALGGNKAELIYHNFILFPVASQNCTNTEVVFMLPTVSMYVCWLLPLTMRHRHQKADGCLRLYCSCWGETDSRTVPNSTRWWEYALDKVSICLSLLNDAIEWSIRTCIYCHLYWHYSQDVLSWVGCVHRMNVCVHSERETV